VRAIGDGISKRDDGAGAFDGGHIDAIEEVPRLKVDGLGQGFGRAEIAANGVVILIGGDVEGLSTHDLGGKIKADGYVGERGDGERDGVRVEDGSGGDAADGCAAKGEGVVCCILDVGAACAQGYMGIADDERIKAELIGEADAELLAAV